VILSIISTVAIGFSVLIGWESAYRAGVRHGRMRQSLDDRHEIEQAVIAKARAEQLAATWEKRAMALLYAHFGTERKP
jgi:hypothetical protein